MLERTYAGKPIKDEELRKVKEVECQNSVVKVSLDYSLSSIKPKILEL
jgi:hypothetical protein